MPHPEDLRGQLMRLAELRSAKLHGKPTLRALARAAKRRSPTVPDSWLKGESLPRDSDALLGLIAMIRAEATQSGLLEHDVDAPGLTVKDFLQDRRWQDLFDVVWDARSEAKREAAHHQQAQAVLEARGPRESATAPADPPRPIRSWTARRLGVHPAIRGAAHIPDPANDFSLPCYVERPHDLQLRDLLIQAARPGAGPLLVVVAGTSCTGKTRTAYEALAYLPDTWQLLFPQTPATLQEALEAGAAGPGTVLWLNEAQERLSGPDGESAAAALLRRLDTRQGPFIALATLWPEKEAALRGTTTPRARDLLAQAHRVAVPDSFSRHLDRVHEASGKDGALAIALATGGTAITQTLAAGPDLVHHYENPQDARGHLGNAVISAAVDARRLGATNPIPLAFLQAAAPGYLSAAQRGNADPAAWFHDALSYAQAEVKEVAACLQPVPHPSGMGPSPDVVTVADYLQQHGSWTRGDQLPPASFWKAAAHHLTDPSDQYRLLLSAEGRLLNRQATHIALHIDADLPAGLLRTLVLARDSAGDKDGAEFLARMRASSDVLSDLARARESSGEPADAERLVREAAVHGYVIGLADLSRMRAEAGEWESAERLAREATGLGHNLALDDLARVREEAGEMESAARLYREAPAHRILPSPQRVQDENADTRFVTWNTTPANHLCAYVLLVRGRERAGDAEGAEHVARLVAADGDPFALSALALMRDAGGQAASAEKLAIEAAVHGEPSALLSLAEARARDRAWASAEYLVRQAADHRGWYPFIRLVTSLQEAGKADDAERVAREAAAHRYPFPLADLAGMREKAGQHADAERLAWELARNGDAGTLADLALSRQAAGQPAQARRLAREAAARGYPRALKELALQAEDHHLLAYGLDSDGTPSLPWTVADVISECEGE
ncbi:tetratricopeptide repeat protein [Streptomyces hydrogenans]